MIKITPRSYSSIICELIEYPHVETGGILLGLYANEIYHIVEATDAGSNANRSENSLTCDYTYLSNIANVLSRVYQPQIKLIGVWHKHNNCVEPPFSLPDLKTHNEMCNLTGTDIVSILFQKSDEEYLMKAFVCNSEGKYIESDFEICDINSIKYKYQ